MKTEWDYTKLAAAYLKRPDYATEAIDRMLEISNVLGGGQIISFVMWEPVRRI